MAAAAGDGQVRLDAAQQAEFYRIKEEAKSKTSKLAADRDALTAAQARIDACSSLPLPPCRGVCRFARCAQNKPLLRY